MFQQRDQQSGATALVGRMFIHPIFDYAFIGGALSLVVISVVVWNPWLLPFFVPEDFRYFVLFSNSAHFASSTVRLYTKPKAGQSRPVVKAVLPLVALGLVTLCMFQADTLGSNLRALYFTWSPYHYAAQTYGLAVMYCYRSGCQLSVSNKRLLWWVAMLPFLNNFVLVPTAGIHWMDVAGWLDHPNVISFLNEFRVIMPYVAFAAIPFLFWRIFRSEARPMPLISALMLFTNGVWWFTMSPQQAFIWATIFHGIQYLAIVLIFHVKEPDESARESPRCRLSYVVVLRRKSSFGLRPVRLISPRVCLRRLHPEHERDAHGRDDQHPSLHRRCRHLAIEEVGWQSRYRRLGRNVACVERAPRRSGLQGFESFIPTTGR